MKFINSALAKLNTSSAILDNLIVIWLIEFKNILSLGNTDSRVVYKSIHILFFFQLILLFLKLLTWYSKLWLRLKLINCIANLWISSSVLTLSDVSTFIDLFND